MKGPRKHCRSKAVDDSNLGKTTNQVVMKTLILMGWTPMRRTLTRRTLTKRTPMRRTV